MLIAGAIVLGALLLFRLNLYEYQPAGGSGPGGAPPLLRINRLTGHAEPFVNGRWIGSVARPLPAADLSRLVGYAALGPHGVFRGNLHNGSGWTITRLVIRLSLNVAPHLPDDRLRASLVDVAVRRDGHGPPGGEGEGPHLPGVGHHGSLWIPPVLASSQHHPPKVPGARGHLRGSDRFRQGRPEEHLHHRRVKLPSRFAGDIGARVLPGPSGTVGTV